MDSSALEYQVKKAVKSFVGLRKVSTAFLRRTRPSHLYVVWSYGCEAPIAAAQDLSIATVEFQHGTIGRGHLGYDFKDWQAAPYFPDRILAFGPDWFRDVHFPKSCSIEIIGYKPLEELIAEANQQTERCPRQLLILSQGPFADQLLQHAASFSALRPDWEVVIRPHPSENPDQLRRQMAAIATTANWRVEKQPSLQEHTAASSAVFGVHSTALIEALLAGCRVALLNGPTSGGYFDALARGGHAAQVRNGEELAQVIDNLPGGSARGYFASPVEDIVAYVEGSVGSQN